MSIGAEHGQCILETHISKKIMRLQWEEGLNPPNLPLWVCQWYCENLYVCGARAW